jgi:hypothetical protein
MKYSISFRLIPRQYRSIHPLDEGPLPLELTLESWDEFFKSQKIKNYLLKWKDDVACFEMEIRERTNVNFNGIPAILIKETSKKLFI